MDPESQTADATPESGPDSTAVESADAVDPTPGGAEGAPPEAGEAPFEAPAPAAPAPPETPAPEAPAQTEAPAPDAPAQTEVPAPDTAAQAKTPPAEGAPPPAKAPQDATPVTPRPLSELSESELAEHARAHYPTLTLCGPQALPSWNGWGLALRGRRAVNGQDGSYLATKCLIMFMLPVFALGAYRVVDGPLETYRFLGRDKLSQLAKVCNALVLAALATALVVFLLPNPAQRALAEARAHVQSKRYVQGARGYAAALGSSEGPAAREAVRELVSGPLRQAPTADAAQALEVLSPHPATAKIFDSSQDDAWLKLALERGAQDPPAALKLLDALEPLAGAEVDAAREELLGKLNATNPLDPISASGLAEIYERRAQPEKAWAVLIPARETLATLEGARILGLLHLTRGELAEADALLTPYLELRLPEALQALDAQKAAYKRARDRSFALLNSGQGASEEWYRGYNAASGDQRNRMVSEEIGRAVESDPTVVATRRRWTRLSRVSAVALELAIVRTARARELSGEAREAQLAAIAALLAEIEPAQASAARYRLAQAKLHFLRGEREQAVAILVALEQELTDHPASLNDVAQAYREAGDLSEARRLLDAAYALAKAPALRYSLASLRLLVAEDAAERLTWLERCDPQDPATQASLAATRADAAEASGESEAALRHYREGAEQLSKSPQTSANLYSRALIRRALWRLGGDPQDLAQHLADLRQALSLAPEHPILLRSLVTGLHLQAGAKVLAGRLDLARLQLLPDVGQLWSLCDDEASYAALCETYLGTRAFQEAEPLLNKLLELQPRSQSAWAERFGQVALRDQAAGYEAILAKLPEVDFEDYSAEMIGAYHAEDPAEVERWKARLERAQARAQGLAKAGGATYALALREVLRQRLQARVHGIAVEGDALLAEAERAHAAAPSVQTRLSRVAAHALRALERLRAQHPALETLSQDTRRSLDAPYVLVKGLSAGDEVAKAIKSDPDVQALAELLADLQTRAPRTVRVWWARLLRALDSPSAEALEERLRSDALTQLRLQVLLGLAPLDAEQVLEQSWFLELQGKAAEAEALVSEAAEAGVPL